MVSLTQHSILASRKRAHLFTGPNCFYPWRWDLRTDSDALDARSYFSMMALPHRPQCCFFSFSLPFQLLMADLSMDLGGLGFVSRLACLLPCRPCPSRDLRAYSACSKTPPHPFPGRSDSWASALARGHVAFSATLKRSSGDHFKTEPYVRLCFFKEHGIEQHDTEALEGAGRGYKCSAIWVGHAASMCFWHLPLR